MATVLATEKRLAVTTCWALCAPGGLCLIVSGFDAGLPAVTLAGFGVLVLGFIAHVVINAVFRTGFAPGELATGFVAFGVGLTVFILASLLGHRLDVADLAAGIAGFAALVACFLVYTVTRFGLKGAFSQFHHPGGRHGAG